MSCIFLCEPDWLARTTAGTAGGFAPQKNNKRQNKLLAAVVRRARCPASGCNLASRRDDHHTQRDDGQCGVRFSAKSRDADEIHFSESKTGTDAANYVTISPCARHGNYITAERRASITEHAPNVTANYSQKASAAAAKKCVAARANSPLRFV